MNGNEKRAGVSGASFRDRGKGVISTPYYTMSDISSQQDEFEPRRIPYDMKDIVKAAVPVKSRVWDGDDKCWHIHRDYIPIVDQLMRRHLGRDELTGLTWSQSWLTLHLRQTAPPEVINVVANTLLAEADDPARRHRIEVAKTIVLEW